MLTDFLYKYTSSDKDCLFALIADKQNFAKLISPLNPEFIWPVTSNDDENWIVSRGIIFDNGKISYPYEEDKSINYQNGVFESYNGIWEIGSNLALSAIKNNSITISTKIKIDPNNAEGDYINLFYSGDQQSHIQINYSLNPIDGNSLFVEFFVENGVPVQYELFNVSEYLFGKELLLTIVINPDDLKGDVIKIYADDEIIGIRKFDTEEIDLINSKILPPNTNRTFINDAGFAGGWNVKMKNFFIWNRTLSFNEIKLLTKLT